MASSRLPGKPLLDIHGMPMVVRVARTCAEVVGVDNTYVLTPDEEILEICKRYRVEAALTSNNCINGTERIAELVKTFSFEKYVNVQGDEPLLRPEIIADFIAKSNKYQETVIGFTEIFDQRLIESESVVKLVSHDSRVVFCSRWPIASKGNDGKPLYKKHVGLYSYAKQDLIDFLNLGQSPLEAQENVEILRLIENGIKVFTIEVPLFGRSVDTFDDYQFVLKYGRFDE